MSYRKIFKAEDLNYYKAIAKFISDTINQSQSYFNKVELAKYFIGKRTPDISVEDYLLRFVEKLNLERQILLMAVIYIDKFCELNDFVLKKDCFHRVFLSAVILSVKYLDDRNIGNIYFAKVGGVTLEELLELEICFFKGLNYSMYVSEEVMKEYDEAVISSL
jgi:hypothetical protein